MIQLAEFQPPQSSKLQESDHLTYCQNAIKMLENNTTPNGLNFTQEDINDFCLFYLQYEEQKVFKKQELPKKCKEASKIQKTENQQDLLFQIRVADSALYYSSQQRHRLRKTQLMAIYLYLKNPKRVKILMEILTGQGKTTIIACLAAVLYMRGLNVDIVTTNQMLAKRDQLQKETFYNLLGIPVGTNFPPDNVKNDEKAKTGPRDCYSNRGVVYGTPSSFQVDILFDEYKRKGTRNKRPFDVIIIDEVDLMFIDNKSSQTLLSTRYAGHSQLVTPMKIIWRQIITNTIINEGQKLTMILQTKEKGEVVKGQVKQIMKVCVKVIKEKFKNQLIQDEKMEFVQLSIQSWIENAIKAAHFLQQNQDYIIENRQIVPIDKSTGAHLKQVTWSNGLHQFLQIKHGLPVFPENMTSNFISNIGHFTRYEMILGLTGTLGSQSSRQFLKKTYEATIIEIPPTFERKLKIDPGYFMFDHKRWMEKIIERCKEMMDLDRSVLIICQDIRTVQVVRQQISKTYENLVIYTSGQEIHSDKLAGRQIIIATNIAGRGMDFKPNKKLVQKGGLHVITTYMPENLRVQMQARGRAGRNGVPGSSELIVNHLEYFKECNLPLIDWQSFESEDYEQSIGIICSTIRDQRQLQRMKEDIRRVQSIRIRDRLFSKFCKTVNEIPDIQRNNAKRKAIQEAWSMLLKRSQEEKLKGEQLELEAERLIWRFRTDSESFYNINHNFERGYEMILSGKKEKIKQASRLFKQLRNENNSLMQRYSGIAGEIFVDSKSIDRQLYTRSLNEELRKMLRMGSAILEERKEIVRADSVISNSRSNRIAESIMKGQSERRKREFREAIDHTQMKNTNVNISVLSSMQNQLRQHVQQPVQIEALFNSPEEKFISAIQKHVEQQIEVLSKLKQGETFQVSLKYLDQIIDREQMEDNSEEQAAFERLESQIPFQPVVKVVKKESSFWKRAVVFALGVAQIYVGAVLIYNSCGMLSGVGVNIIKEGIRDCQRGLFSPQICRDLQKYCSDKTITYTALMSTVGTQGIQKIKQLGLKGFDFVQNSSTQDIVKSSVNALKCAFMNSDFDWKAIAKQTIHLGMNYSLSKDHKQLQPIKTKQISKLLIDSETKSMIKQGIQQEKLIEKQSTLKCQYFANQITPLIKKIINNCFERHLKFFTLFPVPDKISIKIIQVIFKETKSELLNFEKHEQVRKDIEEFFMEHLNDEKGMMDKFVEKFSLEAEFDKIFQEISQKDVFKLIRQSSSDRIIKQLNEVKKDFEKRRSQIAKQFAEIQKLTFNNEGKIRLKNYNTKENAQLIELQEFEQCFFESFISQPNLLGELIKIGVFEEKFQPKEDQYQRFVREILVKLHQRHKSSNCNKKFFLDLFQTETYNYFTAKILNVIPKLYNGFSRRIDILKVIQEKVLQEMDCQKNDKYPFK